MRGGRYPGGLALDVGGGKMYWTEWGTGRRRIRRADLDGTNAETLIDGMRTFLAGGIALDLTHGRMYWAEDGVGEEMGRIRRADLDGTKAETLVGDLPGPYGVALDVPNGKMYWTDPADSTIHRAGLDGSAVELLVAGLVYPRGIALDVAGGKIYWTGVRHVLRFRGEGCHPSGRSRRFPCRVSRRGQGPGDDRPRCGWWQDVLDGV